MWRHATDKKAVHARVELGGILGGGSFDYPNAPVGEGVHGGLLDGGVGGEGAYVVEATGNCHVTLSR